MVNLKSRAPIAQGIEWLTPNEKAEGSNPSRCTTLKHFRFSSRMLFFL